MSLLVVVVVVFVVVVVVVVVVVPVVFDFLDIVLFAMFGFSWFCDSRR